MRRPVTTFFGLLLIAASLTFATPAVAAMGVVVSASPENAGAGQPVEILLHTLAPFAQGDLGLPSPAPPYPVASGFWGVLYPFVDYPFDVAAEASDGTVIRIQLTLDPNDATLWRGTYIPTTAGDWIIRVRNFAAGEPGASTTIHVSARTTIPTEVLVGVVALIVGILVGRARGRPRRHPSETPHG